MQYKTKSLSFPLTCHLSFRLVQLLKFIDTFIWYIPDKVIEWTELCREQSESNAIFPLSLPNTLSNLIVFYSFKHSLSILQFLYSARESRYFSYLNLLSYQKVILICLGALFLPQLRPFLDKNGISLFVSLTQWFSDFSRNQNQLGNLFQQVALPPPGRFLFRMPSEVSEFDV